MKSMVATITKSGKSLELLCVNFGPPVNLSFTKDLAAQIWAELAPFASNKVQTLYIRDLKQSSIDGKYPGGHSYNEFESMVALPSWKVNRIQIKSTIAHELHHLVRWQNAGYGNTLGGAILSEGMATFYEQLKSGWVPPWSRVAATATDIAGAKKSWNDQNYNHAEWFFGLKRQRWLGYGLGYRLASQLYQDKLDLTDSLTRQPASIIKYLT